VLVLQQSAEHYKRNWEQAEEEVQELKSRMQQMEQGGEVQSNHHSPRSYR
jgi:prefoldin subunit 5